MINKNNLSKIGIGTWGIGGFAEKNPENDDVKQVEALTYAINAGLNYIEINKWTAQGHSVELVAEGINKSNKKREELFLSLAIYSYSAPTLKKANDEFELMLKLFKTDYIDSISMNVAAFEEIGEKNVISWYSNLVKTGQLRYINLNNPYLNQLKKYSKIFKKYLFSVEVGFNFEIRENAENGVIQYANDNNILNVVFQPLRRNRTAKRNWPLLNDLARKYNKTQNQIILNWIISKGMLPLIKSDQIDHINENLDSLNFKMDSEDISKINEFRPPNYIPPKVFWGLTGKGVRIDQLSNVFDEEYENQNL